MSELQSNANFGDYDNPYFLRAVIILILNNRISIKKGIKQTQIWIDQ